MGWDLKGEEQLGSYRSSSGKNNHYYILELMVIVKVEVNGSK